MKIFRGLDNDSFLVNDPAWAVDFAPDGRLVQAGARLTRVRYAALLRDIAQHGPDIFYSGPIANATISSLQAAGGIMTMKDLRDYSVVVRTPVEIDYLDFKLVSCGAPAGGEVVLSIMKTIEGYGGIGVADDLDLSTHRLDEATRFGYGAVSTRCHLDRFTHC